MVFRSLAASGTALLLNACVVGAEGRATRHDAPTPPPEPVDRNSAAALLAERSHPSPRQVAPPAKAPRTPTAGYYHWNGVRYEWVGDAR